MAGLRALSGLCADASRRAAKQPAASAMPIRALRSRYRRNPYFEPVTPIDAMAAETGLRRRRCRGARSTPSFEMIQRVPGTSTACQLIDLGDDARNAGARPASPADGHAGRKPGRRAAAVALQPAPRRQPAHQRPGQQPARRRSGARRPLSALRIDPRSRSPPSGARRSADYGAAQCLRRCSPKAGSTAGRCRWLQASTPISRPASSASNKPRLVRRRAGGGDPAGVAQFFRRASALWGGAQPGLARLDVGPRVSLRVGQRMRVHLDYRHKLARQCRARLGRGGDARRRLLAPRIRLPWFCRAFPASVADRRLMDIYLPIAGQSVNALLIVALGGLVGPAVGHVRGRRRLPHHAAADLLRHSADRRGRLGHHPDHRRIGVGRLRPYAARRGRPENGRGDDRRRRASAAWSAPACSACSRHRARSISSSAFSTSSCWAGSAALMLKDALVALGWVKLDAPARTAAPQPLGREPAAALALLCLGPLPLADRAARAGLHRRDHDRAARRRRRLHPRAGDDLPPRHGRRASWSGPAWS